MVIKNKPLFYLIIVFILLNIVDMITTMFILEGESNPIFHMLGSIWPVFILKLVVIGVIIVFYRRAIFTGKGQYYLFITTLVYSVVALGIAQINNIHAILNPVVLATAAAVPTETKVAGYIAFMNIVYLLPILFSWVSFMIYDKSIDEITIDKEWHKKKKWWKF